MSFGVLSHTFDFVRRQTAGLLDLNSLALASGFVLGRNAENTVHVDVEFNFDLRNTSRSSRDTIKVEFIQQTVVGRHLAFALEDADSHSWLIVRGC